MLCYSYLPSLVVLLLYVGSVRADECTDEQYQHFIPILQIVAECPNGTRQHGLDIFHAYAPGLSPGYAAAYAPGFNAEATLFDWCYNISRSTDNVTALQPSDLADLCTVYNGFLAMNKPIISAFMQYNTIAQVYGQLINGILNWLSPQPHGTNFTDPYWSNNAPGAVHIALVPNGMVVSWQTLNSYSAAPTVLYGTTSTALPSNNTGTSHTYANAFMHDVVLPSLIPSTLYFYTIYGDPTQTVYNFTTAPETGSVAPFAVTVLGDMGIINALDTHSRILTSLDTTDLILHIGDLSYADDYYLRPGFETYDTYEESWNMWQSWVSPIASTTPYMVVPGNHEAACQLFLGGTLCPAAQQNFSSYRNRFRMPSVESGAGSVDSMWSSFDYGLVHFVMINTESDFDGAPEGAPSPSFPYGPFGGVNGNPTQLAWLEADLTKANANRHVTPWIVVVGHRPIYTGVLGVAGTDSYNLNVVAVFEPIFVKHNIDIYISGHMHLYERLYPTASNVSQHYSGHTYLNPTAPTYLINGAAGNDERHKIAVSGYNTTLTAHYNQEDYGYAKLKAHNATHLQWQFIKSSTGELDDDFWLVQTERAATTGSSTSANPTTTSTISASTTGTTTATTGTPMPSTSTTSTEPTSASSEGTPLLPTFHSSMILVSFSFIASFLC